MFLSFKSLNLFFIISAIPLPAFSISCNLLMPQLSSNCFISSVVIILKILLSFLLHLYYHQICLLILSFHLFCIIFLRLNSQLNRFFPLFQFFSIKNHKDSSWPTLLSYF